MYPVLVGSGVVAADALGPWIRRSALGATAALQVGWAVVALPLGLPVVAPEPMARYAARLGITESTTTNTGEQIELPQDYADMLGWEAYGDTVVRVWNDLDAPDRERATLLATNYGRAGALDWFGRRAGLPPSVAPLGSYWFWGYGDRSWEVVVVAGGDMEGVGALFGEVTEVARIQDPWRVPEERDVRIFLARDPIEPVSAVWPRFAGRN